MKNRTVRPSRREFLELAAGAPLVAMTAGRAARLIEASILRPAPSQDESRFQNPAIVRYDSSCFTLNGRDVFVYGGAFHYPRCPRELWRDRLLKFRRAGLNTVETCVFWNYHEPEEGGVNVSEFEDFVKLVKELGFWMIARPGPYICAEWDGGGIPYWVAAKRFPLRSNHPESIRTSQHWFSEVLPVIQRQQITNGGPIIMMQIENEYDYCEVGNADKKEYLRALAQMAWSAGIDVPLITCWTKQARERSDADMARLMDTCNFYPRWDVVKEVVPALAQLRREEPVSPLGITELQGGWFSVFGGALSIEQDGVDAVQLNLLAKTAIEQGVTYFNYYMGFGGTNFDWAAKGLTTTYDYAAPIREPGGLWDKYYAARAIGVTLGMVGPALTRARLPEHGAESTNPNVSVTERINGTSAVLFLRENANAEQRYKITFQDPASPTHRFITVPRQDELVIAARAMKMLPVQMPIPGSQLFYSTAEVVASGLVVDRHFLVIYDEPGYPAEISLATQHEPQIEGDTLYRYWDEDYESVTVGLRFATIEKILFVNDHLYVIALPRERALRTWTAQYPAAAVPGQFVPRGAEAEAAAAPPLTVPFISDAASLGETGAHKNRVWADLSFKPGAHDLMTLLPPQPTRCYADGVETEFKYDRHWRTARVHLTTP
ncbi:MAG TPA: beta-galactosidase, partial [Terriglobia bacterium]|nr:beta-galactosidase [Terriglobia bacterium]